MANDMTRMLDSMETSIKLQHQARARRRAEKAEEEQKEFQKKLMSAAANKAASKAELDGIASKLKGCQDAVQRDQLIAFMMAGFF